MNPITDSIVGIVGKVIDKIFPDPVAQAQARLEFLKLEQSGELEAMANDVKLAQMQTDINKEEAKSASLFIAGWRPYIGWVCGIGFTIQVIGPLLQWIAAIFGKVVVFPPLDLSIMLPTLMGMLGLSGMRTFEKWKNVEGNR